MYTEQQLAAALRGYTPDRLCRWERPGAEVLESPWAKAQLDALRTRAAVYSKTPVPPLRYRDFRLYWDTGDRLTYQTAYYDRRGRLLVFSLLQWLEPSAETLASLEDIIWEICAEAFWCLPAHFLDEQDQPIPFEAYAGHLDLFACETAFALAECNALVGDQLSGQVRAQLDAQVRQRVLLPFADPARAHRFEHMENNWSAVCAGAVGGAALYLELDPAIRARILARTAGAMEVYLGSFGQDGACEEGLDYWSYGFGFYVCWADLLARATGGAIDPLDLPKANAIALTQQVCFLQNGITLPFSDGHADTRYRMGLTCFLRGRYEGVELPGPDCANDLLGDTCYRFCLALRDLAWLDPSLPFGAGARRSAWLPDVQWLVSRGALTTLAAKGGHNGESHNHNDVGSFLYIKKGVMLLCDLGAGLYDRDYFSPRRFELFVPSSYGHSLPLVDGLPQSPGREFAARDTAARLEQGADHFTTELAACYPAPHLTSLRRQITHCHESGRVALRDSFLFTKPAAVEERFITGGEAEITREGLVVRDGGESLTLTYDPALFDCQIDTQDYMDFHGQKASVRLVRLLLRQPAAEVCFEAEIQ